MIIEVIYNDKIKFFNIKIIVINIYKFNIFVFNTLFSSLLICFFLESRNVA